MADIFISYVRADRPMAERLANALKQDGWTVWWDTTLLAGESFEAVITEQLQTARCVVVLWSAGSVVSDWVRDEASEAKRRRLYVPCLIEPVSPPMGYRQYHTANLSSWDGNPEKENYQELKRAIAKYVSAPAAATSMVESGPAPVDAGAASGQDTTWKRKGIYQARRSFLIALPAVFTVGVIVAIGVRNFPRADDDDLRKPLERGLAAKERASAVAITETAGEDGVDGINLSRLPMAGIVGRDDRVLVTQTTSFPWSAICSLIVRANDGSSFMGTGVVIGPTAILTADYIVFPDLAIGPRRGAVEVQIIPARNGKDQPFGRFVSSTFHLIDANEAVAESGRSNAAGETEKVAVIELREPPATSLTPLKLVEFKDSNQGAVTLAGYPGDKPAGQLWRSSGRVVAVESAAFYYDADTWGGMSGAPVWWSDDGEAKVVGIHFGSSGKGKHALRITEPLLRRLEKWIRPQSSSLREGRLTGDDSNSSVTRASLVSTQHEPGAFSVRKDSGHIASAGVSSRCVTISGECELKTAQAVGSRCTCPTAESGVMTAGNVK